jgi:hypothetical protein
VRKSQVTPGIGPVVIPGPFLVWDARARSELRYQPVITRQLGLQRLPDAIRAPMQPANAGA